MARRKTKGLHALTWAMLAGTGVIFVLQLIGVSRAVGDLMLPDIAYRSVVGDETEINSVAVEAHLAIAVRLFKTILSYAAWVAVAFAFEYCTRIAKVLYGHSALVSSLVARR